MNKFALLPAVLAAALSGLSQVSMAADDAATSRVPLALATHIVGHPAGGTPGRAPSANFEHPAVVTHRAGPARIDTNRYLVQPPAATVWLNPTTERIASAKH